jgi:hypothetical protein
MGDFFQSFAAVDVARADARATAARVRAWLQVERIICGERGDSTLGGRVGYRPGPSWHKAVAPTPRGEREWLTSMANGVEIIDTPTAFYSMGEDDSLAAVCPHCGADCDRELVHDRNLCHFEAWQKGDDAIVVTCPHCAAAAHLLARRINAIVLAHVGLQLWNWPTIADDLVAALARQTGSKIITLRGKL